MNTSPGVMLTALSTLVCCNLIANPASAISEFSANIGVASDYIWRGVSKTDSKPQIFGGIDYTWDSGLYTGTWLSNTDMDDVFIGESDSYEINFYAGYSGILDNGVSYDAGYIYYAYPNAEDSNGEDADYDTGEIYGSLTYNAYSLTAYLGVNNGDDAQWNDGAVYLSADAEFDIAGIVTVLFHLGSYTLDDSADDYFDYGASLNAKNFSFGFAGTDLDDEDVKVFIAYTRDFDIAWF